MQPESMQPESMHNVFDITTIIFLALAVLIFLRLRSVLGQRTGRERPPYDPYSRPDRAQPARENVVALPAGRPAGAVAAKSASEGAEQSKPEPSWTGIAEPGSTIANGLDAIANAAPDFDVRHFLTGARAAYEMIVNAFADGDRRVLKNLLSRDVYDGFENAINEREKRGEHMESHFVSIDGADIVGAEMRGCDAQMTVRFQSQLVSVTRDRDGKVIDGQADKVTDVIDVWTFSRDVSSHDPNWRLVATEAGR